MGFLSLLLVASMPVVQVLLIGVVGAFLASGYSNILTSSALSDMNKVVFTVFTPSLMFASLAKTVTFSDVISWWFMPINIGITFMAGGTLGWIACKILKPSQHFRGMIVAFCSAGNLGNLLLIVVPAVCDEDGNPFGKDSSRCRSLGISYSSLSMALGGLYIWTHTYSLMKKKRGQIYHQPNSIQCLDDSDEEHHAKKFKANGEAAYADEEATLPVSAKLAEHNEEKNQMEVPLLSCESEVAEKGSWTTTNRKDTIHHFVEELMAPPTLSAILGFVFGLVPWLKSLVIGDGAPLRVIQDSIQLMGNGTIPCVTLILGGNLIKGLRKSELKRTVIIAIICIRYVTLPLVGIAVVHGAYWVGFLPHDPLYRYVLMMQFALPPAMTIGTMAQLFDVAQEECSVIFLWTYLVASISLTTWSTIFMSILS